jgi:putative cell wall-binding protein
MRALVRRPSIAVLAVFAVAAALFTALAIRPAEATSSFSFTRPFNGTTRYETARLVAQGSFGQSRKVILTTGTNFPDALAANYLAGVADAPILLTPPDALAPETLAALQTLDASTVRIVGGRSAISADVENDLRAKGYLVDRVAGPTRFGTALSVAEDPDASNIGFLNGERTAILATGNGFADALAAGPLAFAGHFPVLLTLPGSLVPEASQALSQLGIQRVLILGGGTAVNQGVEDAVRSMSINVTRIAGFDRTATAAAIAEFELANPALGFSPFHANLARGDDAGGGVDALAGGPHAGREHAPILLTAGPDTLDTNQLANARFLYGHLSTLSSGHLFGGPAAITDNIRLQASYAGGLTPTDAISGLSTPTVYLVNVAEHYFVSTTFRTYRFDDGNDVFQLKSAPSSQNDFAAALNPGDTVTVDYNAVPGKSSTFNLTNDTIETPATPSVFVSGNHVGVLSSVSPLRSLGTQYTLQRAAYSSGVCGQGAIGAFTDVAMDIDDDGVYQDTPPNGCYQYRVVASVPVANASYAISGPSGDILIPQGVADTLRPRIVDLHLTDAPQTGVAGAGDVHGFTFSEGMSGQLITTQSGYVLSDPDGTTATVVCGTNATCEMSNVTDGALVNPRVIYSTLKVTLTAAPATINAGAVPGIQYPATIVSTSPAFIDASGNPVDPALSDVTL